ncbi:hypothetical protein E2C01_066835 [Portunus trituberculatus]|uniref:Uncharacterized protein n=1 Tax=Portunus trituberculatus TaxID=210409 RepID=A0A5B7HS14_PORTR|nr:hypothetical protein [Portunus trituberculatus]
MNLQVTVYPTLPIRLAVEGTTWRKKRKRQHMYLLKGNHKHDIIWKSCQRKDIEVWNLCILRHCIFYHNLFSHATLKILYNPYFSHTYAHTDKQKDR